MYSIYDKNAGRDALEEVPGWDVAEGQAGQLHTGQQHTGRTDNQAQWASSE
jgi:hypothetical protein